MPSSDALSDEAVFEAFQRGLFAAKEGDLRDYDMAGIRAVKDHILRVLAEQAGDPETLAAIVEDTLSFDADWSTGEVRMSTNHAEVAQAVAARVAAKMHQEWQRHIEADLEETHSLLQTTVSQAKERVRREEVEPLAAEVLALREALENLRDEQNDVPLLTREREWRDAMRRADELLARPLPDAVKRMEAEARLGRIVFWRGAHDNSWAATDTEYRAALDALRALEGGGGA